MSYKIEVTSLFEKQLKRLAKKYPSLAKEFKILVSSLKENPFQGVALGRQCFKIRMSISSKGKGKSGGARVISHIQVSNEKVYLLSIYDKSEIESLTHSAVNDLLDYIDGQG
jgi:mRNA-degrading endonuclease RelE of RelBE toxin-antitoxin system